MAAVLKQGRNYNLSSASNENKTILYVKLTDSALRAVEEYHFAKNAKRRPTISFSGTIGSISIPQKDSDAARTFDFTLQKPGPDEFFECIHQSRNKMMSLGPFSQKLTIQASDDVYQNTVEKMSLVEENRQRQRAKEIKTSGQSNVSRLNKILTKVRNNHKASMLGCNRPKANLTAAQRKQAANVQPKVTPANRVALVSTSNGGRSSPYQNLSEKNGSSSSSSASSASSASTVTPAMKFSLRERIIHLLAVRTYKKPELLLRLQQDGLDEKDKEQITQVLEHVAQQNSRDGSYSLQRYCYIQEVKQDWPLFNDSDRQLLNKKLNSLCLPPSLNPRTISPCPSNGSQGSPPRTKRQSDICETQKRLSDAHDGVPQAKKMRVAHSAKRDASSTVEKAAPSVANSLRPAVPASGVPTLTSSEVTEGAAVSSDMSSEPDDEDYKRIFTPIQTYEQRRQYKAQFDLEHKEHQEVYQRISKKVVQLNRLQEQIEQEKDGTAKSESLRNEIFDEYFRLKNDAEYMKDRSRYEYQFKKLAYIKKLVYDYDLSLPGRK